MTKYGWEELAPLPRRHYFRAARVATEAEERKAYQRIYQSGWRWCRRNRPDLRPAVRRTIGGFLYSLVPKETDR